jgi:hypothetical protein
MSYSKKKCSSSAKLRFLDNLFEQKDEPITPYILLNESKTKMNSLKKDKTHYIRYYILSVFLFVMLALLTTRFRSIIIIYMFLLLICSIVGLALDYFYFRRFTYIYKEFSIYFKPYVHKKRDYEIDDKEYHLIDI